MLNPATVRNIKELEQDNARLKRLLADAVPDKAILREAASDTNSGLKPLSLGAG